MRPVSSDSELRPARGFAVAFALRASAATLAALFVLTLAAAFASAAPPTLVSGHRWLAGGEAVAIAGADTLVASFEPKGDDVILSVPPAGPSSVLAKIPPNGEPPSDIDLVASASRVGMIERGITEGYKGCCASFSEAVPRGSAVGAGARTGCGLPSHAGPR